MKNTTAIAISFLRPGYTIACVESLRRMYPDIKIIIGENAEKNEELAKVCEKANAKYIQLPFDSGVCKARNALMKHVDTKYVLVGDDDFYYDEDAKADAMETFLENHDEYDLIGGRVTVGGVLQNYQGTIERHEDYIRTEALSLEDDAHKLDENSGLRYQSADLTFNYFIARADKVREVPWDEEIKVAYEHFSWFADVKEAGYKVAFTPDAVVVHKPEHVNPKQQTEYPKYRNRQSDKDRFFERFNIDYFIGMNGVKLYKPGHVVEARVNDTKYVDFCVTTFKRPEPLERLLTSIAKFYPMANIYVADQNEVFDRDFYKGLRHRLHKIGLVKRLSVDSLPYDCGLSYARNHLVKSTPNKYKLILDDDMEFVPKTDIGKMVRILDGDKQVSIVGGLMTQKGTEVHFEFTPEIEGNTIYHREDKINWQTQGGIRYRKTGCVLNFTLFRKEVFDVIQWDPNLKVTEHLDFYLRMKATRFGVAYTPDVVIDHPPAGRHSDYKEFRTRPEFQAMMLRKHKVTRVKYINGQVTELTPDGSLSRYKEPLEK